MLHTNTQVYDPSIVNLQSCTDLAYDALSDLGWKCAKVGYEFVKSNPLDYPDLRVRRDKQMFLAECKSATYNPLNRAPNENILYPQAQYKYHKWLSSGGIWMAVIWRTTHGELFGNWIDILPVLAEPMDTQNGCYLIAAPRKRLAGWAG